eukprot:342561_1
MSNSTRPKRHTKGRGHKVFAAAQKQQQVQKDKSPTAMSTSSQEPSPIKFGTDIANIIPTTITSMSTSSKESSPIKFGTDIANYITPNTITSEQTDILTKRISKPYVLEKQRILSTRINNAKYARMQREMNLNDEEIDTNKKIKKSNSKHNNSNLFKQKPIIKPSTKSKKQSGAKKVKRT